MSRKPIPEDIRTEIMLKCARHCVLCHKPCGTNIEIHHIIPVSKGETNDFDNLIPLCFDCHAKVGSYNREHPKGTKYGVKELKRIRDDFYSKKEFYCKVSNNHPCELEDKDKQNFIKIAEIIRNNDYSPTVRYDFLYYLIDIKHCSIHPFFKDSQILDALNAISNILALTQIDRMVSPKDQEKIEYYAKIFLTEYYKLFY